MSEELNEAFLDYMSYLVFMAAQLPWGYGSFALVKGLGKVLELKAMSGELQWVEAADILGFSVP